jgi:hypothetical protein
MKSIADQLPPEIARQIHPDRRKNEAGYWAVRDQLLEEYRGQWIGFAEGKVIASGSSPVTVFHAAEASGQHPFLICVGKEDQPCRIRRAAYPYDASYPGEARSAAESAVRRWEPERFAVGDLVVDPGHPTWGIGRVIEDRNFARSPTVGQRLVIQWSGRGIVSVFTALRVLQRVSEGGMMPDALLT